LEVLLLLLSLFLLKTALSIHFFLKALNKSNLLGVSLLLLDFASVFVFVELLVSSLFLLHDALLKFGSLLQLLLLKELDVLILQIFIHKLLFDLSLLSRVLFFQLFVQLFLNESLSFTIAQDSLLLLFVVKKSVELLDGSPLILLFNLGVSFSLGTLGTRSPALGIERLVVFSGSCFFSSSLRKTRCARDMGAGN
jgi:hypothetical protein